MSTHVQAAASFASTFHRIEKPNTTRPCHFHFFARQFSTFFHARHPSASASTHVRRTSFLKLFFAPDSTSEARDQVGDTIEAPFASSWSLFARRASST
jgi:hypothetical protein